MTERTLLIALASETCPPQLNQPALPSGTVAELHALLPGWAWHREGGGRIFKRFAFADYYATMAFVNVVAAIAHATNHHPDLAVHFCGCEISFNTHDVTQADGSRGGLSRNDFVCAARIEIALSLTQ